MATFMSIHTTKCQEQDLSLLVNLKDQPTGMALIQISACTLQGAYENFTWFCTQDQLRTALRRNRAGAGTAGPGQGTGPDGSAVQLPAGAGGRDVRGERWAARSRGGRLASPAGRSGGVRMTQTTTGLTASHPLLQRLADLTKEKAGIKDRLSNIEEEMRQIQGTMVDQFLQAGTQSVKGSDGRTYFLWQTDRAKVKEGVDREAAIATLFGSEDSRHLVRLDFNLNSISSWLRSLKEEGREMPPTVAAVIEVEHSAEIRVRGA
jgi:hypothetical protein